MTLKNVMKGSLESIHFIYARKPESQKVFAKYMRTNDAEGAGRLPIKIM